MYAIRSYYEMIEAVTKAEEFLNENADIQIEKFMPRAEVDLEELQKILSNEKGCEVFLKVNQSPLALHYASQRDLKTFATRGVLTPEHIIRTNRITSYNVCYTKLLRSFFLSSCEFISILFSSG